MKTTIGGDRLGSGNKQNVSMRNYERSTHDLGYTWRSSMAAGTLVPFLSEVALPGDSWDIDLNAQVLTLPTIGPLFGSFKVQLDVFCVPVRLYNAALHMNKLGIGMDMSKVFLPRLEVPAGDRERLPEGVNWYDDNAQVNPSSIYAYLGIRGNGYQQTNGNMFRAYNGVPYLAYWEIYKNYYANKQEERGFAIHVSDAGIAAAQTVSEGNMYRNGVYIGNANNEVVTATQAGAYVFRLVVQFPYGASEVDPQYVLCDLAGQAGNLTDHFENIVWNEFSELVCETANLDGAFRLTPYNQVVRPVIDVKNYKPQIEEFPLANIDLMRQSILQSDPAVPFEVNGQGTRSLTPYVWTRGVVRLVPDGTSTDPILYAPAWNQEGLGLKTYQSDLFNNWISTEWIDGANGINAVTAVDTTGGSFTIDTLNLSNKVYNMLNRIAISGGSYDDWLDAVYTHERTRSVESPQYMGSLIKELAFQEVVSTADTQQIDADAQPLGTLAGRGKLTGKNKGGKIKCKVNEISYIIGIVSLTPRIDYSQGNKWDVNLNTMNDFHKPALDAIGYQDLITEQQHWASTTVTGSSTTNDLVKVTRSAGKQPAWINYMTAVNRTLGNFAKQEDQMFMTCNRRYEIDGVTDIGAIKDLTTYIDPSKYNFIFAQTSLDAQNFWVQIACDITARRKMSAKVIPNL